MEGKLAKEALIAAIADAQHGVVTRTHLLDAGFSSAQIDGRIRARHLNRVHQGVYAVGHRVLTTEGRWMAATLATGGVLSHATAAAAWDLRRSASALIHVTIAGDTGPCAETERAGPPQHDADAGRDDGVARHPDHHAGPHDHRPRTDAEGPSLEQLVDLADQRGLIDFDHLRQANSASLQAVLRTYSPAPTRSELEERFLRLCDDHGLPRPETNTRIEGIEVDFAWRDRRLIVEVDGYAYHRSPASFERDRERDVTLTVAGWCVLRFTWGQIATRGGWVAGAIRTGAPPISE